MGRLCVVGESDIVACLLHWFQFGPSSCIDFLYLDSVAVLMWNLNHYGNGFISRFFIHGRF